MAILMGVSRIFVISPASKLRLAANALQSRAPRTHSDAFILWYHKIPRSQATNSVSQWLVFATL